MPDRLERQLSDELHRVAASAEPPADAWERFTRRAGSASAEGSTSGRTMRLVLLDPETGDELDGHQQSSAAEFTMQTNETTSRPRRRLLLGAVAALAALAVAGVAFAVSTDDDSDEVAVDPESSASTIELVGAEGNDAASAAFSAVEAAYQALNAGDLGGWLVPEAAPRTEVTTELVEFWEFLFAMDAAVEDLRCEYLGSGEYAPPDDEDATGPWTGHQFECAGTFTSAFSEASGVTVGDGYTWVVDDGRVVYSRFREELASGGQGVAQFTSDYLRWLFDEHPDVAETLSTPRYPFEGHAEDAPVLLDHLDEFVEQSDKWPVEED